MSSEVTKDMKEPILSNTMCGDGQSSASPPETFTRDRSKETPGADALKPDVVRDEDPASSSSYTLASDQSLYSQQVDSWLRGGFPTDTQTRPVDFSRMPPIQRLQLPSSSSRDPTGLWYLIALVLPFFSANTVQWGWCTPDSVTNAGQVLVRELSSICTIARLYVRRLADERLSEDFFACIMDIVLVIYAIGFLVISAYQANFFR